MKPLKEVILDNLYADLAMTRNRMNEAEMDLELSKREYHMAIDRFNELNDLIGDLEK